MSSTTTSKTQSVKVKAKKSKDPSEKKSKKRQREENTNGTPIPAAIAESLVESPPKKARLTPLPVHPKKKSRTRNDTVESTVELENTRRLRQGEDLSPLVFQTASLHVPLPPVGLKYANKAIQAEHFSPMLLSWQENLRGVVISYDRVKLSGSAYLPPSEPISEEAYTTTANSADEESEEEDDSVDDEKDENQLAMALQNEAYGAPLIWASARFLLFRPHRGMKLEGWINLQNEGVMGIIVWNLFSASVGRTRIPKSWKWIEASNEDVEDDTQNADGHEEGHWLDSNGNRVQGLIFFWVVDFEVASSGPEGERGFISIEGTLLNEAEEKVLVESERAQEEQRRTLHGTNRRGRGF